METARAANVALVEHFDDGIGRVLAALRETGLDRTTLVVFCSDNGGSLPHAQNNDPWRDGKQSHYEGGLRVPFIARWPGTISAGSRSDYAGLTFDIFATCLEAFGTGEIVWKNRFGQYSKLVLRTLDAVTASKE